MTERFRILTKDEWKQYQDIMSRQQATHSSPPAPAPDEKCYIITETLLRKGHEVMSKTGRKKYEKELRSRPHTPAAVPSSKELILLAEMEWHNREERKHLNPMIPWTHGWMSGFLTPNKPDFCKQRIKSERERVLVLVDHAIEHCPDRSFCLHNIQMIREGKFKPFYEEESLREVR